MGSAKIEGELWGGRARDWAEYGDPSSTPLFEAMLNASGVSSGTKFLDLGCGAGGACVLAAQLGANVTGFDASENLLQIARERLPSGRFDQGEIEELPYADGSFDVVFAANSVQYAENQDNAVREALRVTSSDGRFVLGMWCEPERCDLSGLFKALAPDGPPPGAPPTLSDKNNLCSLLERSGAKLLEDGEVACTIRSASMEDNIRGCRSAGIMQLLEQKLGEEFLRNAIFESHKPFEQEDGSYVLTNWFRWVLCAKA